MTLFVLLCMTITSVNAQVNLALDKPVYASSKQEEAKNAVDGKDNTRWQAAEEDENEWWYVDLGEEYNLDFVEILWEGAFAKRFELYGATDEPDQTTGEGTWSLLGEFTVNKAGLHTYDVLGNSARFIKFVALEREMVWGSSFFEFRVFKATADPVLTTISVPEVVVQGMKTTVFPITLLDQEGGLFKGETTITVSSSDPDIADVEASGTDKTLSVTGKKIGTSQLTITATSGDASVTETVDLDVISETYTWNALENIDNLASFETGEGYTIEAQENGVSVTLTQGPNWVGVRLKELPKELKAGEYSYVHVIGSCATSAQSIKGRFGYGEFSSSTIAIADEKQDFVFKVTNTAGELKKLTEVVIMVDYSSVFPKAMTIEKIVFNNSADEIVKVLDEEAPEITSVALVDESITYSSVGLTIDATDNIGVYSYIITDDAVGFSKEILAPTDGNTITVKGLNPNTEYTFSIVAKDLAGNLSEPYALSPFTTEVRESECQGIITEKNGNTDLDINYSITYNKGKVTFRIAPIEGGPALTYGQVHRMDAKGGFGFVEMNKQEDGSYTLTPTDTYPVGMALYTMFVWNVEGHNGNVTSANNDDYEHYVFAVTGECSGPLEKEGTDTDLILSGKWDADLFAGYELDYAKLTTIDLIDVIGGELPAMENLNPNCLIYVDKSSKISDTSKNIVVFNNGEGNAEAITLEDGHPFNNTKEFTAASISYTRDFSGMNGWASLYLPFAVKVEGYTIETLADYTSQEDKGYFSFESVTRTRTTANTPYIMAVNSETNGVFTGSGIVPVATAANDVSIDNGTYVFKGTFNEIAAGSANGLYLLRTDGSEFAVGSDDSSVPAFRAYITSNSAFAADRINVLHDGEVPPPPTKINAQNASTLLVWSANGVLEIVADKAQCVKICSIDGCIVRNMELNEGHNVITNLPKGIYIVNNQKVIIK